MKVIYTVVLFLIGNLVIGQDKLPLEIVENIEKRLEYDLNPSIAIGIVDENGPRYYTFGANAIDGPTADEHSIYEIGSISKVFTAILLADQVLKGNMSIDDPISKYLPETVQIPKYNGQEITLGHLSDHTSSLPRMPGNFSPADPNNPYADYTPELLYEFISSVELQREIGSEYEYSNLAQGLLGHILELKTGKTYEQLLREVITKPLGMDETRVQFDDKMLRNLAKGYSGGKETSNWDIATLTGAGAIRSSVFDMLKFLSANLGLSKSPLSDAMKLTHAVRHDKAGGDKVGLAWHIFDGDDKGAYIGHSGATGGYRAFSAINKVKNIGVVVLTNSDYGASDIGRYLMGASEKLNAPKRNIAPVLREIIDSEGIEAAMHKYDQIKKDKVLSVEYNFDEGDLNNLGYHYLTSDKLEPALAIFELNINEHPDAFNPYDSYAEALMKKSILNYRKSIELNPNNQNGYDMLAKMGEPIAQEEVTIDDEILSNYVGRYQLAPTFFIDITMEPGHLYAQATGQPKFELFAKDQTNFYLKVVDAQMTFDVDDTGSTTSLTLHQNGQHMPGKKVD